MDREYNLTWMDETIERVPKLNWLYKFCCFMLLKSKKKMTYNEMFMLLYGLNRRKLGESKAKQYALAQTAIIYQFQNNKLPNM